MSRITVLGGCGSVGSHSVRTLVSFDDFSEVTIADINIEKASSLASDLDSEKLSTAKVDALDPSSVKSVIRGSDVVLNCIGPFYRFAPTILKAVLEVGVNYVDICDDVDATRVLLGMDETAKRAGVTALIGMGSSPGVTNLLARFAAESLLDEVDSIDLYHAHGGEPTEGEGVIAHRIHSMMIDIPVFLDGQFKTARFFDETGNALREEIEFHGLGKHLVYPYPHPEVITLPRNIPCSRVTNKGTVLPPEYFQLIIDLVRLGLVETDPVEVRGQRISPFDFTIAYVVSQRDKILKEVAFGQQRGCVKIVVKGKEDGEPHQYIFSLFSQGQAMGEGTGIPAALGAILMKRGKIQEKGVLPPEASVLPLDFLGVMQEYLKLDNISGEGSPLLIESVDNEGNVEQVVL